MIQASGMSGPIPPEIGVLAKLSDLWVEPSYFIAIIISNGREFVLCSVFVEFLGSGESATWKELKQLFHHWVIWQTWIDCELNAIICIKIAIFRT